MFSSEYQKYSRREGKTQEDFSAKQISTVGSCGSAKKLCIVPQTKFLQTCSAINTERVPLPEIPVIKKDDSPYISLTWAECILLTHISHLKCLSPQVKRCQGKSLATMSLKATIFHCVKIMPSKYIVMLTGNGINIFSNPKVWRTVMRSYLSV